MAYSPRPENNGLKQVIGELGLHSLSIASFVLIGTRSFCVVVSLG